MDFDHEEVKLKIGEGGKKDLKPSGDIKVCQIKI